MNVLIAEEDSLGRLARALERYGHHVEATSCGAEAIARVLSEQIDVAILDSALPQVDGLEACRRIRAAGEPVPILMLGRERTGAEAVAALDDGADDYLVKPIRLAELEARLRALTRRGAYRRRLVVDRKSRRAWLDGRELGLTRKEFDLLSLLEWHRGAVVTRSEIMRDVWQTTWYGDTKTLDMHVSSLRHKLQDEAASPRLLVTVRGVGYRLGTT